MSATPIHPQPQAAIVPRPIIPVFPIHPPTTPAPTPAPIQTPDWALRYRGTFWL